MMSQALRLKYDRPFMYHATAHRLLYQLSEISTERSPRKYIVASFKCSRELPIGELRS